MTRSEVETLKDRWRQLAEVTMRIAVPVLLGAISWLYFAVDDLRERVTKIEASRYTAKEAASDRQQVTAAINKLEVDASAAAATAREVKERLSRIDSKLDRLLERD